MIAINDAYRLAPWAQVLYACDQEWWLWHNGVPAFTGLKYALMPAAGRWPGVQVLENTGENGLESASTGLRNGHNSGYQAMNLALHLGAARIVLLGYDMQRGERSRGHFFGEHPNRSQAQFHTFQPYFDAIVEPLKALGVEVFNCSRETALTCFPRVSLAEALA